MLAMKKEDCGFNSWGGQLTFELLKLSKRVDKIKILKTHDAFDKSASLVIYIALYDTLISAKTFIFFKKEMTKIVAHCTSLTALFQLISGVTVKG